MANIVAQRVESGAQELLSKIPTNRFSPRIVGEIAIKATGLLAGSSESIEWDKYDNPFVVIDGARVSLALVLTHQDKVFVYNRNGATNLHGETNTNVNEDIDIIGAIGFGVSSLLYKIPAELVTKKVANSRFSDYLALEETDGTDDKAVVKMPIVICELTDVDGVEEYFVEVPAIAEGQTAKLQAAIKAFTEK